MNCIMHKTRTNNSLRWIMLVLMLVAFVWRLQGLGTKSLWRDEVDTLYFALGDFHLMLSAFVSPGQNGPLYFLSLRPWLQIAGSSEFALRFPSACFGVLAIPFLWLVARRLIPGHDPDPASVAAPTNERAYDTSIPKTSKWNLILSNAPLLAAIFFAVNPYQVWYGQEGRMYSLVCLLALLAAWFWLKGIDSGGWWPWVAYMVTVSIAIYSHLLMILLIPLHLIWFIIAWPKSKAHWRIYGLALAGLTVPYAPMLWWQWDLLMAAEKRTGFPFTPLPMIVKTLLMEQSRGFWQVDNMPWLVPTTVLGLIGLAIGFLWIGAPQSSSLNRLAAWRRHLLVVSWLLLPVLMIYILSLRQPVFQARYVIWIAPAAMMLLALGVQWICCNMGLLARPLTIGLVAYVVVFWLYAGWQQKRLDNKYDLRGAVTYISERRKPDDLLILQIPHMAFAYRYYSSDQGRNPFANSDARLGRWADGLWTNHSLPDDRARIQADQQMLDMTAGTTGIWVMRSEVDMWDRRHLMDQWLDDNAVLVEEANFHGTQVRYYQMHEPD